MNFYKQSKNSKEQKNNHHTLKELKNRIDYMKKDEEEKTWHKEYNKILDNFKKLIDKIVNK